MPLDFYQTAPIRLFGSAFFLAYKEVNHLMWYVAKIDFAFVGPSPESKLEHQECNVLFEADTTDGAFAKAMQWSRDTKKKSDAFLGIRHIATVGDSLGEGVEVSNLPTSSEALTETNSTWPYGIADVRRRMWLSDLFMHASSWSVQSAVSVANDLIELESMGRDHISPGIAELMAHSVLDDDRQERRSCMIGIFSMLFLPANDSSLRTPVFGCPRIIGGLNYSDCSFPFYKHKGVLFLLVQGYTCSGRIETCSEYLAYCIKEGRWRTTPFEKFENDFLQETALDLIENGPWKDPLDESEKQFILRQVEHDWQSSTRL